MGDIGQFGHLDPEVSRDIFALEPTATTLGVDRDALADRMGATLYTPATRAHLFADVVAAERAGTASMVLDLEDSVHESEAKTAEDNLRSCLAQLWRRAQDGESMRLALFVRVRHLPDIARLLDELGASVAVLAGIVAPKFRPEDADACFAAVRAGSPGDRPLYVMPVIESREFIQADRRIGALADIRSALEPHRPDVLMIRIGGTDLAGIYGLRRTPDLTIYDVQVVSAALGDIVNMLGVPGDGYAISGPVWEHFAPRERVLRPQLRATPFVTHDAVAVREELLLRYYDGLIGEVLLDRANGMTGKSVIHPDQAAIVNAMSVVTDEEYADARQIVATGEAGGAAASAYGNKMNESKPHAVWAQRVMRRAAAFGVARPGHGYIEILAAQSSGP